MGALFASLGSSLFSRIVNQVLQGQKSQYVPPAQIHTPEVSIHNNGVV